MISKEDYLKLIQSITDSENEDLDICESAWISADSRAKELMLASKGIGYPFDITNLKRSEIEKALLSNKRVTIGNFSVIIDKHSNEYIDLEIWEKHFKTPSGNLCNMDFRVDVLKDNRFDHSICQKIFNHRGDALNISIGIAVDAIKWIQAIVRIGIFM